MHGSVNMEQLPIVIKRIIYHQQYQVLTHGSTHEINECIFVMLHIGTFLQCRHMPECCYEKQTLVSDT